MQYDLDHKNLKMILAQVIQHQLTREYYLETLVKPLAQGDLTLMRVKLENVSAEYLIKHCGFKPVIVPAESF